MNSLDLCTPGELAIVQHVGAGIAIFMAAQSVLIAVFMVVLFYALKREPEKRP